MAHHPMTSDIAHSFSHDSQGFWQGDDGSGCIHTPHHSGSDHHPHPPNESTTNEHGPGYIGTVNGHDVYGGLIVPGTNDHSSITGGFIWGGTVGATVPPPPIF